MKSNLALLIFIVPFLLVTALFSWLYLFNVYEVDFIVTPQTIKQNSISKFTVDPIPMNSFGNKAILRNVDFDYEVRSEEGLRVVSKSQFQFTLELDQNFRGDKIQLIIKSQFSETPNLKTISVE